MDEKDNPKEEPLPSSKDLTSSPRPSTGDDDRDRVLAFLRAKPDDISRVLNQAGTKRKLLELNQKVIEKRKTESKADKLKKGRTESSIVKPNEKRKTEPMVQNSDDSLADESELESEVEKIDKNSEPETKVEKPNKRQRVPESESETEVENVNERRRTEPKVDKWSKPNSSHKSKPKLGFNLRQKSRVMTRTTAPSSSSVNKRAKSLNNAESDKILDLYRRSNASKIQMAEDAKPEFEEPEANEMVPILEVSSSTLIFSGTEQQNKDDIFGFLSKLTSPQQDIFKEDNVQLNFGLEYDLAEQDDERDMTWLFQTSTTEQNPKPTVDDQAKAGSGTEHSWKLFWLFLMIGGRMPFHFEISSNKSVSEHTHQIKKNSIHYWAFLISSIILTLLTIISIMNLIWIAAEEEVKGDPHIQIEKLLLAKHAVSALVFITSLVLASISSINVLLYGDSIAQYMTLWEKTLEKFHLKAITGVMVMIITYIVWTILIFLLHVFIFSSTNSDPDPNPFIESIHLLIAIVFRSFVPNILIQINGVSDSKGDIQSSPHLWKYGAFIVCLNAYVLYCSRNFVIMVMVDSIWIRDMATEWNFRLRLILRQINVKKKEHFLRNLNESLIYKEMFDWHRNIVLLVQENSKVYCTILATFYLAVGLALAVELLELAITLVGREDLTFSLNETAKIYAFEKDSGHFIYLCFHMSQTIGIFLFVSLFLAETGSSVMSGVRHLARHNYIDIISSQQRKFVMSLSMSFSARKPHLLGAGGIFSIDRYFIICFLAFLMHFFSVMIQTRHPQLLNLPIVVQCPPESTQFCVNGIQVTAREVPDLNNRNARAAAKFFVTTTLQPITTTRKPRTTTTPKPGDNCTMELGVGAHWYQKGTKDAIIVELPKACDYFGPVEPYPDNCMRRVKTGTRKPFEFLDSSDPIVDCKNPDNKILDQWRDDCLNVPLFKVNSTEIAKVKAVEVASAAGSYVMCCYDYGYTNGQLRFCNQDTTASLYYLCGIAHDASSFVHPYRIQHVDPDLKSCIIDPSSEDPKCVRVHKCFCGTTRNYIIPPTPSGLITCPP